MRSRPATEILPLFLSSGGLISLLLCSLLPGTLVSRIGSQISQLSERTTLDRLWYIALLDLSESTSGVNNRKTVLDVRDEVAGGLGLLFGSITLLVLAEFAWEENETLLVLLEAVDVDSEGFDGEVLAAGIDGDTDGWCKLAWDSGFLFPV